MRLSLINTKLLRGRFFLYSIRYNVSVKRSPFKKKEKKNEGLLKCRTRACNLHRASDIIHALKMEFLQCVQSADISGGKSGAREENTFRNNNDDDDEEGRRFIAEGYFGISLRVKKHGVCLLSKRKNVRYSARYK